MLTALVICFAAFIGSKLILGPENLPMSADFLSLAIELVGGLAGFASFILAVILAIKLVN